MAISLTAIMVGAYVGFILLVACLMTRDAVAEVGFPAVARRMLLGTAAPAPAAEPIPAPVRAPMPVPAE